MKTYLNILATTFFITITQNLYATFSMVAIDTKTNETGSILATCLNIKLPIKLADYVVIHHNAQGIMNVQSDINKFTKTWITTANGLMAQDDSYFTAEKINKFLMHPINDSRFVERQLLTVKKSKNLETSAHVYTGKNVNENINEKIGLLLNDRFTYAIAGNLLSDKKVINKMEESFINSQGTLADKLITTLKIFSEDKTLGDKRCLEHFNINSNIAFIRTFENETKVIDIEVSSDNNKIDATYLLSEKYNEVKKNSYLSQK